HWGVNIMPANKKTSCYPVFLINNAGRKVQSRSGMRRNAFSFVHFSAAMKSCRIFAVPNGPDCCSNFQKAHLFLQTI
ncbi:MAG: hypothetical protein J5858_09810, partial [Lentisphaeria bacterium]|nr:hypothetical protein [Lentisphaeria bacterium]